MSPLDLAPSGVSLAVPVTWNAGALLPHRFTLPCVDGRVRRPSGVCFLLHFPASCPDWPLASTLPCGAPTFLDCRRFRRQPRLPGQLTVGFILPRSTIGRFQTRHRSRVERSVAFPENPVGNCGRFLSFRTADHANFGETRTMNNSGARHAVGGVLSGAFGLAVGELVAGVFSTRSPVVSVGDRVVDGVPAGVKRTAISLFGTNDKVALFVGIFVILGIGALFVGRVAARSFPKASLAVAGFGAIGAVFALTGRLGTGSDVVPVLAATIAAIAALYLLVARPQQSASSGEPARSRLRTKVDPVQPTQPKVIDAVIGDTPVRGRGQRFDRRQFVALGSGTALASIATAALGRRLQGNEEATKARSDVVLPTVAGGAPTLPTNPAAQVDVPGMTPFFIPNGEFYRIDTALVVPRLDVRKWTLKVDGMVRKPLLLSYDDLQKFPLVEHDCTLMCVSNEIGGGLVGNARWLGVRLADVLNEAGVKEGANQVFARSSDGFTAGFPTKVALDGREALLAFGMNGEPLPFRHGYPVRLVVPGIYGYVSAVKWLTEIKLTTFEADEGYWIPRGWSALGPIKTGSRIDVPGGSSGQLRAGKQAVAGVAWAQHTGISKVEVQIDGEEWQTAELAADGGIDTWRQWKLAWDAPAGQHSISVRATDATGATQTEERAEVAPDGATGWHTIQVNILK